MVLVQDIDLEVKLQNVVKLNEQAQQFIIAMHKAARHSSPFLLKISVQEVCYPLQFREMVKERRNTRRISHQFWNPEDKSKFSLIDKQLNRLIANKEEPSSPLLKSFG